MTDDQQCDWKEDEDGIWATACGQFLVFDYGSPKEHGYKFCHRCGKPIQFTNYQPKQEEE